MNENVPAAPTFLTIGPASRDIIPGGWRWGGVVTYASLLAHAWGVPTAVLTTMAPAHESDYRRFLGRDVCVKVVQSPATTSMANVYSDAGRQQHLHARAAGIEPHHVPHAWHHAPVVLVGPLVGEVSTRFGGFFPRDSLVGMTIQGRLRSHRKGRIYARRWHRAKEEFSAYDVIFFSIEDVRGSAALAEEYASFAPLAVVTRGVAGATLYQNGKATHVPAIPARPVDPTGAGDVFAAAFLLHYADGRDPATACRYANAAAACSIEYVGASGMPAREKVRERLRTAGI